MLLVALVGTARADDREDARREFAAGQAADTATDWQGAIEHYIRANELIPHPFAMFNIATDYERLHNVREAAIWYQRYLDAAPTAPNRADVARRLDGMKLRPASLAVRSIPDGAYVSIDGAQAGRTPLQSTIRGGTHRIAVDLDGQHQERQIDVQYAEPVDVQFTLSGPSGTIDVQGTPFGAAVSVDGVQLGRVPVQLVVAPGRHTVHVENYGFTPLDTTVDVAPDGTAAVPVALTAGGLGVFTKSKLDLGWFIGLAGGGDTRGAGAVVQGELGVRLAQYELAFRAGSAGGATAIDFMVRFSWGTARLAPYIGIGYSYVGSGLGYEALGGLRYDLSRGKGFGLTARADIAVRAYQHSVTDMSGFMTTETAALIPISLTLEAVFR